MGRGRQKAKATKQAREMKYFSPGTDLSALERELTGGRTRGPEQDQEPEYEDPYADLYAEDEDDDARCSASVCPASSNHVACRASVCDRWAIGACADMGGAS